MLPAPKRLPNDAPTLYSGSACAAADDTLVMGTPTDLKAPADETIVMSGPPRAMKGQTIHLSERRPLELVPPPLVHRVDDESSVELVDPALVDLVEPEPAPPAPHDAVGSEIGRQVGSAFVKAYRFAGFLILAMILGGLATYLGTHLFFLVNRGWAAPAIVTPADPRVLSFASRFVEESARKDALLVQRADVEMRRRDAARHLAIERAFQAAYTAAMREDLADRKADLLRAKSMLGSYAAARRSITSASDAFRTTSEQTLAQELEAGVIDKTHLLGENLQLAQMADARLSLDARNVELQGRVAALSRIVDSLDSATKAGAAATSYEVLKIRAEFDRSVGAAAKAADELEATTKSVAMIDDTLRAEDRIIEMMKRSAYHGVTGPSVFVFVPYDNAVAMKENAPVFSCRVGIVWCRKIGLLERPTEGEVVEKHPVLHHDLRGRLVRAKLDDPAAAENAIVHLGRRPLLF